MSIASHPIAAIQRANAAKKVTDATKYFGVRSSSFRLWSARAAASARTRALDR